MNNSPARFHIFTQVAALGAALLLLAGLTGCSTPTVPFTWSLTGTNWMVTELEGKPIAADKLPTLQLEPGGNRVNGFGGVNRFTGTCQATDTALSFSPLATTRMAGPERQMAVEQKFLNVLGSVTGYALSGNRINLLAGETIVARGQAMPATPFPSP